jgi:GntR family transcriptional repressor for pyruvate dehydrogenase complex
MRATRMRKDRAAAGTCYETEALGRWAVAGPSMRPQRVAEMIADQLRGRVLRGELRDGDRLPREEGLLVEFPVAKASLREAMRILETEGLITILRGAKGGAVVRTPKAANAAYTLGLVLSVQRVPLEDVAQTIRQLEPICALLCAERPDRDRGVVPRLRALQAQADAALTNPMLFMELTRRFHEEIVASCRNQTMILLVGTLEALWSRHVRTIAEKETAKGRPQSLASRRRALAEHQHILDAIAAGDSAAIRELLVDHLERVQRQRAPSAGQFIDIEALRP